MAAAELVPVLDWRSLSHYDPEARQYVLRSDPGLYVDALATLCGITTDASGLISLIADRHPIVAAKCLSQATVVDASVQSKATETCNQFLSSWHPTERWIGASMAGEGRLNEPGTVTLLSGIIREESEWQVRDRAYHALEAAAPGTAPISSAEWARLWVDDALSRFGQEQHLTGALGPTLPEALREMLRDASLWTYPALIAAAEQSPDRYLRSAAKVAIRLRAEKDSAQLLQCLDAGGKEERLASATVLGWAGSVPAVATLVGMLSEPDADIRAGAMLALSQIRADEATPRIRECADGLLGPENRIEVQAATVRALSAVPGATEQIKSASKVLEAAIRKADPDARAEDILSIAEALHRVGDRFSGPVLHKLADIARRAPSLSTRERAFAFLLRLPKGRDWILQPIYERLMSGDYQGVIDEIGMEEPFVLSSPNLYLWRSIAFSQLGQFKKAINDARTFLTSARDVSADLFAFYHKMLRDAGDTLKLADAERMAKERLPKEELKRFKTLIVT